MITQRGFHTRENRCAIILTCPAKRQFVTGCKFCTHTPRYYLMFYQEAMRKVQEKRHMRQKEAPWSWDWVGLQANSALPWWLRRLSAFSVGDPDLILGLGRSPQEGNDYPLQYSCLENPMDTIF